MMKSKYIGASILASVAVMLTLTTNCDNVRLNLIQPTVVASKIDGEICTQVPSAINTQTKIIFMVDESGSNKSGNGGGPGTDPNKTFRYNTIKAFVDLHAANSKVEWGMIVYQGANAFALINQGGDQNAIFSDSTAMYAALTQFQGQTDQDATPWNKAMNMALAAITTDRAATPVGTTNKYLAVMMSDGVPSDYGDQASPNQANINADADRFPTLNAELSAIYYGPDDEAASERMRLLAEHGKGKFSDVNKSGQVPLDNLLTLAYAEPWVMKRFMVANLNAAPCDDGTMDADSDSDGLCDKDEVKYNQMWANDPTYAQFKTRMNGKLFDPLNRNSFHPAFNDLAYFKFITQGDLLDTTCMDTTDDDHDLLNLCEEKFLRSSSSSGPTPSWTGKMKTDSDPLNYDSDGDGITDWLEMLFERTSFAGLNYNSTSRLIDGFRMDEMITQYRNPRNPKGTAQPYDGDLRFSRINGAGQSCYTYHQTVLPLYKTKKVTQAQVSGIADLVHNDDENIVLVYFIQTPQADPNGVGEMRWSYQKMKVGQTALSLNLNVDDYKFYRATAARAATP